MNLGEREAKQKGKYPPHMISEESDDGIMSTELIMCGGRTKGFAYDDLTSFHLSLLIKN